MAIELTKRLRELVEDFENGRTYFPRDDLGRFAWPAESAALDPKALSAIIRDQARRNRAWYDRGLPLLALLDARGAACVVTMTGIHRRELDRIERSANKVWASGSSLAGAQSTRIASTAATSRRRQQHGPVAHTAAGHFRPHGTNAR